MTPHVEVNPVSQPPRRVSHGFPAYGRATLFAMDYGLQRVFLEGFEAARIACLAPMDGGSDPEGCLAPSERAILASFRSHRRRRSFIVGRVLAKQCVQEILRERGAHPPGLSDIPIERHGDGRPEVVIAEREGAVRVSISHGGEYAMAAGEFGRAVGVDVEPVTDKAFRLRDRIAADSELDVLFGDTGARLDDHAEVTRLFSAKEAMAKCLGTHLFHALHHYRLVAREGEVLGLKDEPAGRLYRVRTRVFGRHVFSLLRMDD
jgi:phosphopantetheinyl transferase